MLSLAMVSQNQAASYYAKDEASYYDSKKGLEESSWWGKGAETLGLRGPVTSGEFKNLIKGHSPDGTKILSNEPGVRLNQTKLESFERDLREALANVQLPNDEKLSESSKLISKDQGSLNNRSNSLKEEIFSSAVQSLERKYLTKLGASLAVERIMADLQSRQTSGQENKHPLNSEDEKNLKEKLGKAYASVTLPSKSDQNRLPEGKREKVIEKIKGRMEERDFSEKAKGGITKILENSIKDRTLTSKKIRSAIGQSMKILKSEKLAKLDQISFRRELT
ncbi:MAG: hypothetical protein EOP04_25140, partial [Proteobacteria bacterium]